MESLSLYHSPACSARPTAHRDHRLGIRDLLFLKFVKVHKFNQTFKIR